MAQLPHYELKFDAEGRLTDQRQEADLREAVQGGAENLFLFTHGWNNSPAVARELFQGFFGQVEGALPPGAASRTVTAGVVWPSIRWPDETEPASPAGGAVAVSAGPADAAEDVFPLLRGAFPSGRQQQALGQLEALLSQRPHDPDALRTFQGQLTVLAGEPDAAAAPEDQAEEPVLAGNPELIFDSFADLSPVVSQGGAAAGFGAWGRVWRGAREALRATTYYAMKKRAGVIGRAGLGPLLGRLQDSGPVRIHLAGHSFGARLVSFSLTGLPPRAAGDASPVKSMFLVQGAFSHFAFAATLPFSRAGGALAGQQRRVDGPVVVTYSRHDLALADFYPRASLIHGQDAAAKNDLLYRWSAMGWDGAQEVKAASARVGPVGERYSFSPGGFLNLDCNQLIKNGRRPSGAHSDIIHPELGWVAVAAAGLGPVT